ncbi:MAG: sigma-70 family RNA polymerase sigma factor [Bacteroidota bacterium]
MNLSAAQTIKIIEGCMANERQAQESLYKLCYADMLRVCIRYLKTDELAKEALNMGFLKVFQHINAYQANKGEPGAWIRTIMVRTCIDLRRKELKFAADSTTEKEIADQVSIEPEIMEKLYAEDLLSLIRKLPDATQMVFNLYVIDGYSHKEISEQLAITESTSRWHLSEGKKQLRSILEPPKAKNHPTENQNQRK